MKRIIITGVSRGIGKATAQLLLQSGYNVIGTSTSGKSDITNPNFKCYKLELDDSISINTFVKTLQYHPITYDAIINNAAILLDKRDGPESKVDMNLLRKTFEVNFFGAMQLTEGLLPHLNPNSTIINISSSWGAFSDSYFTEYQPHYKMSKAALNMYSKLLSKRLESKGITVAALDPGWVKTDMGSMDAISEPEEIAEEIKHILEHKIITGLFWRKNQPRDW